MSKAVIDNLACITFKDIFGKLVADILSFVSTTSVCSLKDICNQFSHISSAKVKKAVLILLHHHFLTWIWDVGNAVYYKECTDNILSYMRCPLYIFTTREKYGKNVEVLVDAVLKEGSATASQAIINAWIKITKYSNDSTTIETLIEEFQYLVKNCYIQRCPVSSLGKQPEDTISSQERFNFSVDQQLISSIKNETESYTEDAQLSIFPNNCPTMKHPDSSIYWQLNYKRFDVDVRDKMVRRYICDCNGKAAGPIFDNMLRVAYKTGGHWEKCIGPISVAEIREKKDYPHLMSHIILMNKGNCKGIVEQISETGGGQYTINMEVALRHITEKIINRRILAQFGTKVHRVYRSIRLGGFIDKSYIEKVSMMCPQECSRAIGCLLGDMYISSREFKKGTSASFSTGNIYILYNVELTSVIRSQYKLMLEEVLRLTAFRNWKLKENQALLEKKKKINVLIDHFKVVNPENVKELEDMMTDDENKQIEAVNASLDGRIADIIKSHSQAQAFELYLYYQSLHN